MVKNVSLFKVVRVTALVAIWAAITYTAVVHQQCGERPGGAPTIHALCPLGGLATLYGSLAQGEFLKRTHPSAIVLLASTVMLALVFRRAFCGWICPLGGMQELFATIGRKARWRLSLHRNAVDGSIRWLKVAVLVAVIGLTWFTGTLVFSPYDPWAAYAHIAGGLEEIRSEFIVGTALLVISLVGSLFVDRLWCRYLCPLGGFLAIVSRIGAARVVRDEQLCVNCHVCDRVCPVDIRVEAMKHVTTGECLTCGECVNACPVPGALQFRIRQRVLPPVVLGIAALAIFFGVVLATKASGTWKSLPESMAELTEHGGELSAENIRGFMTFNDIADAYGLPAEEIIAALDLPPDTALDQPVNSIMHARDRKVEEIHAVVARHLGAPSADPREPAAAEEADAASMSEGDAALTSEDIKGTMSFAEISATFGISSDVLIGELGLAPDTPVDTPIKTIMGAAGRTVQDVRDAVAELEADA